ncbi:cytochrome d ubiquinol oxidase subunit II [Streptomyces sp. N2-109]|uniref:Cytochrome d ubiquinol oxidase subunit II n=1 Tax=Streptomyces gossypii TaxID=2883101 RepID=A0ABT2JZN3_9ACTN|nr:cytochrome d ubiquinol oxidase subunit II [Streptomyces gossypii]MCT2592849.1 cytochrome d ubiquinol oxidase subunit II [Streptomyces gossypii]
MESLAIALLGFFTVGYFVLAGADLGIGMLLPALARGPWERRLTLAATGPPLARGGEMWLLAAVGVLLCCLPGLPDTLLPGPYAVLVPLFLGTAARGAGLWRRERRGSGQLGARLRADGLAVCGSWLVALSWGWLLAVLLTSGATQPLALGPAACTALAVTALFALHGLAFGALRLTGKPFERARLLAGRRSGRQSFALTSVAIAALPLAAGTQLPLRDAAAGGPVPWLAVPVLLAVALALVAVQLRAWRHTFGDGAGGGSR